MRISTLVSFLLASGLASLASARPTTPTTATADIPTLHLAIDQSMDFPEDPSTLVDESAFMLPEVAPPSAFFLEPTDGAALQVLISPDLHAESTRDTSTHKPPIPGVLRAISRTPEIGDRDVWDSGVYPVPEDPWMTHYHMRAQDPQHHVYQSMDVESKYNYYWRKDGKLIKTIVAKVVDLFGRQGLYKTTNWYEKTPDGKRWEKKG